MYFFRQHRNHIYIGITLVSLLVSAILLADFGIRREAEKLECNGTVTTKEEKEKKDKVLISTSIETIRDGLTDKGVLITQEYYFTQVETYTKEKAILNIFPSSSKFVYSYDGAVMAGVDFKKISIEKDDDRRKIVVDIPDSEIRTITIDKDTFKIYSEKDSIWNPLNLEDYNISLVEFENAAEEKALASGILEKSDEEAKKVVRDFIDSLPNTSGYTIEFMEKEGVA